MYEGQAHLVCEALLFDWAENYMQDAEALYEKHGAFFNRFDIMKFLVKKSSFLKKFGFFDNAIAILFEMENELMEILKTDKDSK
jgi:hypothetical protein